MRFIEKTYEVERWIVSPSSGQSDRFTSVKRSFHIRNTIFSHLWRDLSTEVKRSSYTSGQATADNTFI